MCCFDLGKAEIRPEAEAALDKVGAVIQEFPNSKVRINGYTDSIGSQKKCGAKDWKNSKSCVKSRPGFISQ